MKTEPPEAATDLATQKLLAVQRAQSLTTMAMGIAHDFNNLLAAVLGNANVMLRFMPEDSPARENALEIQSSAHQAMELVRQLTTYCGKAEYHELEVNLPALVQGLESSIRGMVRKNTTVVLDLDADMPSIKGDPDQLGEMIVCLVQNAVDAMCDSDGALTVACGTADLSDEDLRGAFGEGDLPADRYAFVEVTDTGSGLDRCNRLAIFEPRFSTRIRGRGMGLAVAFGVIRTHGGAILVRSAPQCGSSFRALFPLPQGD